jgi:hypothetical protein
MDATGGSDLHGVPLFLVFRDFLTCDLGRFLTALVL